MVERCAAEFHKKDFVITKEKKYVVLVIIDNINLLVRF